MSGSQPPPWRWLAAGLLLGVLGVLGAVVARPFAGSGADVDRAEIRARASESDRALWQREWDARARPWTAFPDPPGRGPVQVARYWVSHGIYEMEVRRRGNRATLGIHGIDEQVMGGGWTAFGEGEISPSTGVHPFAGSKLRITWSCLGIRYRYASDGVGYLEFSADGRELVAQYMAYEDPTYWARAHGRLQERDRPPWGSIRGQIALARRKRARFQLAQPETFEVQVKDPHGAPIANATVQPKGNDRLRVRTDARGIARFTARPEDFAVGPVISAGAYGYRNADAVLSLGVLGHRSIRVVGIPEFVNVVLPPMHTKDDERYVWQQANPGKDPDDAMACGTCHEWQYQEWIGSRHALSNDNGHVRFVQSQIGFHSTTRLVRDCDGCHRPGHAAYDKAPFSRNSPLAANHCDLCHKISHVGDVREAGAHGAIRFVRPDPTSTERPGGIHQVFGPRADSTFAYMGAVQNPLFESSHLCASCHQGGGAWKETGLPKMNTFEEWRAWAATRVSDEFRSCQDCHMRGASTRNDDGTLLKQLAWDGIHRTPAALHNHRFEGTEPSFARDALDVKLTKRRVGGQVHVSVGVTNVGAGHNVPTGSWTKHVVVGVWAQQAGEWRPLLRGPRARLVDEDPPMGTAAGDWRNPPGFILGVRPKANVGKAFETPFLGFVWPRDALVDTRLAPAATAQHEFTFLAKGDEPVQVEVRIVHRRGAFGATLQDVPWEIRDRDPMPQVLWKRVVR